MSIALCGSLHPSDFQGSSPLVFFIHLPSILCCSIANTSNHDEQVCDIHGNIAVVRYEPCPPKSARLHATVTIGGGKFLFVDRPKFNKWHFPEVPKEFHLCVCRFSSPYYDTLTWFPRASAPPCDWWPTGSLSPIEVLMITYNHQLTIISNLWKQLNHARTTKHQFVFILLLRQIFHNHPLFSYQ